MPNFHGAGKSSFEAFVKSKPLSQSDLRTTRTTSPKYFPLMYFSNLENVNQKPFFMRAFAHALSKQHFTMKISAIHSSSFARILFSNCRRIRRLNAMTYQHSSTGEVSKFLCSDFCADTIMIKWISSHFLSE